MAAGKMPMQETIHDERKHMEHFGKSELAGDKPDVQKQIMGGYGLMTHQMERMMMRRIIIIRPYIEWPPEKYTRVSKPLHTSEDATLTSPDRFKTQTCSCSFPACGTASYYGRPHRATH